MKNKSFNPEAITKLGYVKVNEHTWEVERNPERDYKHKLYLKTVKRLRKLKDASIMKLSARYMPRYGINVVDRITRAFANEVLHRKGTKDCFMVSDFDKKCLEVVMNERQFIATPQSASKPTPYNTTYGRKNIKSGITDLSNLKREATHIQTAFDSLRPELERKNPKFVGKSRAKVAEELYHGQEVAVDGKLEAELKSNPSLDGDYSVSKVTIEYQVCGYPAKAEGWTEVLYGLSDKILETCKKTQPKNTVSLFDGL